MTRSAEAKARRSAIATRRRACLVKRRYTRLDAQARAAEVNTPGDPRGPTTAYRCPFCHRWHIGHVPTLDHLYELAAAIRWFAGNAPTPKPPPPGEPTP